MSDLHALPLVGHDLVFAPAIRASVWRTSQHHWYWNYSDSVLNHGPFASHREAYDSAHRMVSLL